MKTLKDYITPIITVLTLLAGMAYSSGLRDEKVTAISQDYQDLKIEVLKLRSSVERLNDSMIRMERRSEKN